MRNLTILLLVSLWLTLPIMANPTILVSPKDGRISVKLDQGLNDSGQQVFVSYDYNKTFEQITWPYPLNPDSATSESVGQGYGQALSLAWSKNGLLLIYFSNLNTNEKINQEDENQSLTYVGMIGIFDPIKKIIYWIDGQLANQKINCNDITLAHWISDDQLSYHQEFWKNRHVCIKKDIVIKIDPEFLSKIPQQDFSPLLNHFIIEFKKALINKDDLTKILQQMDDESRIKLLKFIKLNPYYFKSFNIEFVKRTPIIWSFISLNIAIDGMEQSTVIFSYNSKTNLIKCLPFFHDW